MARPTKPGNVERGWNDPPVFLHTQSLSGATPPPASAPPPPRTLLNRRVAHPGMSGGATSTGPKSTTDPAAPPPPMLPPGGAMPPAGVGNVILFPPSSTVTALPGPAPIIVPHMAPPLSPTGGAAPASVPHEGIEVPDFADDNQMFLYVTSHLKRVHRECQPLLSARVSEEVTRKLGVFETMWESGKISYPVKAAMARLSIALCHRHCDVAHEIHMGLMMDYVSEVGQWMVGIKRLIQEARTVAPVISPDGSQVAAPLAGSTVDGEAGDQTSAETRDGEPASARHLSSASASQSTDDSTDLEQNSQPPPTSHGESS